MTPPAWLLHAWRSHAWWLALGAPLAWCIYALALLKHALTRPVRPTARVIVVGNISLGGSGKTSMVGWLARQLAQQGNQVHIVSKGYGRVASHAQPRRATGNAACYGDEPAMLSKMLPDIPVWVCDSRRTAVLAAKQGYVICDDGLQDYSFAPRYEIGLIDGNIGHASARLFPWGILREPVRRLSRCQLVLQQGGKQRIPPASDTYTIAITGFTNLATGRHLGLAQARRHFARAPVQICLGLANNQRVFAQLAELGFSGTCHSFGDHFCYSRNSFASMGDAPILLSAKDGIKCQEFCDVRMWQIDSKLVLAPALARRILANIESFAW